jgi:hypothetical protein
MVRGAVVYHDSNNRTDGMIIQGTQSHRIWMAMIDLNIYEAIVSE